MVPAFVSWDPNLYLRFAAYRGRPAEDLLARLTLGVDGTIYDLGCGPGNLTRQLQDKWPQRRVVGVDSSAEMLAEARKRYGQSGIDWQAGDITQWRADAPAALVFSNAALHWVHNHATLFPHLMRQVAVGGLLAIQMPMTAQAKYQACIRAVKNAPRWKARFAGVEPHDDPQPAGFYYDLIAPLAAEIDLWETDYHHILAGAHPVTDWIRSTGLVPFLSVLNHDEQAQYIDDYNAAADAVYPRQADGTVLFTLRRLFLVAKRR